MDARAIVREVYLAGSQLFVTDGVLFATHFSRLPAPLCKAIGESKPELIAVLRESRIGECDAPGSNPRQFVPAEGCIGERACAVLGPCSESLMQRPCERPCAAQTDVWSWRDEYLTPEPEGTSLLTVSDLFDALHAGGVTLQAAPGGDVRYDGNRPSGALHDRVKIAKDTMLTALSLVDRLERGEALCDAATGAERDRLEAHWMKLLHAYEAVMNTPLEQAKDEPA